MSYGVLSFLLGLFYFFRFIKISDAVGAAYRPLARSSSLPDIPERNLTQYVRLLMGTENGGHTFAGSTIPFGMAKAVADSFSGDNTGGFVDDAPGLIGISQLHDSGTGGSPSLGNFPIWINNCTNSDWKSCPTFWIERTGNRVGEPAANVGNFGIEIDTGYYVEMTSTRRTNLFRMTALNDVDVPILSIGLMDLSQSTHSSFAQIQNGSRVVGNGTFNPSFGVGTYSLYFCLDLETSNSQVMDHAFVRGQDIFLNQSSLLVPNGTYFLPSDLFWDDAAVLLQLTSLTANEQILVRMGMSFISTDQACSNAEAEIPDFDFDTVSQSAVSQFEEILNRIRVDNTNVTDDVLSLFYSSVSTPTVLINNYTGENPLWETNGPTFESYYCIWDTFRYSHPLYNILVPEAQAQMIESLIDIYRHEGWLPDCRMSFCKGFTQGGSNADNVLADAFIKGINPVSWSDAFEAIQKDAEVQAPDPTVEGRVNIFEYQRLGYVPVDANSLGFFSGDTASRTLEYTYNDFNIAMFARHAGNREVYDKYIAYTSNWKNLWDETAVEPRTGVSGFIQGRFLNGSWAPNPLGDACTTCFIGLPGKDGQFYEESAWTYSWFVPHDNAQLIELVGGKEQFIEKLDIYFDKQFANFGNEPDLISPALYHYAGRPDKTVLRTSGLIDQVFSANPDGLPGNDDSGTMGAYMTWIMSGLFPMTGQSVYLIIRPAFPAVQWTVHNSRIVTHNFGPNNLYIQNVTVDGEPWSKNWISHDFFSNGQTMEITLGETPSSWGTGDDDVPPSLSTGGFAFD